MRRLQPLRHKLALLISALLFAVVATFGWFANDRVQEVVESAAAGRMSDASDRVAGMLGQSGGTPASALEALAATPAVRQAVRERRLHRTPAAAALLDAAGTGSTRRSRALFLPDCTRIAAFGPHGERTPCRAGQIERVSPFRLQDDSVSYSVAVPVVAAGDTIGSIVETLVLTGSGVSAVEDLIGKGARLRVGNAAGDLWTDLARAVAAPVRLQLDGRPYYLTDAAGVKRLTVARPVPQTPWVLVVQLPHATIVAPARQLLASIVVAALIALVLGALGAYRISRHVTAPLEAIKTAATGIAGGDYSQRVTSLSADELGELAAAFNSMAAQVETATDDLKAQALELEERMDALTSARRDTQAAHSLLDDVLASAPVGVAVFDHSLRILKVNAALTALTGLRADERGDRSVMGMDPAMRAHIEPLLREVVMTGTPIINERVSMRQANAARHWLTSVFPVRDHDGTISGAGLVVLDTTSHQELEERYLQSQKMDAVGRLAGGVAHDFNNLLTLILSYTSLALDGVDPESELAAELREILDAGDRAASLTRQLLAFSRRQVMQSQRISLNEIASNMERMLQRLIGEDISLELRLAEDLWTVRVDPGQMEQVLLNLAINARDAMPGGGQLRIETQNRWITSELSAEMGASAGEYVALTVEDTGVGMTWEVQRHLFEPFFTTKEAGKGTGLGLATVYGIVKQSAGDIHVQSAPGEGTRFTIYLPVASGDTMPAPTLAVSQVAATGTETVLLLEDDPSVQTLGSRVLRRAGYNVLDARSPAMAIQIARTHPDEIHLLLTDVVLPEMNGAEAAEVISRIRPGMRTLFMSGYTADEILRRGVNGDPSQFLQKPFTPVLLTRKVRDALDAPPALAGAEVA
jgi:PAS domain S-box-containing protein